VFRRNSGAGLVFFENTGFQAFDGKLLWNISATADVINVTFNPSSEGVYSQTITLSGIGGGTEVVLAGTAVPEPFMFIIYGLSFIILK